MKEYILKIYNGFDMKSKILKLSLIMFSIHTLIFILGNNIIRYCLFVDIYTGVIGVALIIIITLIELNMNERYLKYLCWGHMYTSIFIWVNMNELIKVGKLSANNFAQVFNTLNIHMIYSVSVFELIIVSVSMFCYKRKIGLFKMNTIYFVTAVITYTFTDRILSNYFITNNKKNIYIYLMLYILLVIFTTYIIYKFSRWYKNKELSRLILYMNELLILNIWMAFTLESRSILILYLQYTFRLFIYVSAFIYLEREIFTSYYEQESTKIKNNININKKENISLKKKEKILIELEDKSKKSIGNTLQILDNIPDGMMIFKEYILIYYNKIALSCLGEKLTLDKANIKVSEVVKLLIQDEVNDNEIRNGFKRNIAICRNGFCKEVEVNLINVENNVKVLVIKDTGHILENIKVAKEYNEFLKDEETKEEFYSNISHELRTPINVISVALRLNEDILENDSYDIIRRNNNIIKQNCNRLIRTINNFIDSNKIADGMIHVPRNTINLVYAIDDIVSASSKYVKMKDCKLIFDPSEEEIYIYINIEQLNRVFFNIISNALKYGDEDKKIYIIARREKEKAEIRVVYKSKEIPKEKINSMFERFSKLNYYLTRDAEGSGLGLYITKKIIERSGGSINFTSNYGENIFTINIPLSKNNNSYDEVVDYNLADIDRQADIEFSDIYF